MEFVSRLTTATTLATIVTELTNGMSGNYDFGILFSAPQHSASLGDITQKLRSQIIVGNLIACSAAGIVGSDSEVEGQPATALILAKLPDVKILPFVLTQIQLEGLKTNEDWYRFFEIYPSENPIFVTLPDPFLFDVNYFLHGLNQAYPKCPVIGGLASAASSPRENTLILNGEEFHEGVVGFVLTGNLRVETVVSQGCKPIGQTYIVTAAHENRIQSLAGRPFFDILKEELGRLSPSDQLLSQEAIFLGIAMNEYTHEFKRGDFLIRGFMGLEPGTNNGIIAEYITPGQTVQFHLRDAMTAKEDLSELLNAQWSMSKGEKPKGAIVFSCNGRGVHLFGEKSHDIQMIQKCLGPISAAGFFCAGEIGPVGSKNFLHGFTSSIALFYPLKP